jgi:hypothetical protein
MQYLIQICATGSLYKYNKCQRMFTTNRKLLALREYSDEI